MEGRIVTVDVNDSAPMRRVIRGFRPDLFAAARQARSLSRGELGRLSDTTGVTIGRWEDGPNSPQIDKLARATAALGIEMSDVIVVDPEQRFLSYWRHMKGWTQYQLADETGLSKTLVEQIERGERHLDDRVQAKLAAALGISEDEVRDAHARVRARPAGTHA